MKIFNYKQLLIILKPKYNYPIICRLIIQQLRQIRFKHKQHKLLNNLLKYKVISVHGTTYNRFDIVGYTTTELGSENLYMKTDFFIDTPEVYCEDNTPFKEFSYFYTSQTYSGMSVEFDTLVDLIFEISIMNQYEFDCEFYHIKFTKNE